MEKTLNRWLPIAKVNNQRLPIANIGSLWLAANSLSLNVFVLYFFVYLQQQKNLYFLQIVKVFSYLVICNV